MSPDLNESLLLECTKNEEISEKYVRNVMNYIHATFLDIS